MPLKQRNKHLLLLSIFLARKLFRLASLRKKLKVKNFKPTKIYCLRI